ncbi:MAG: CRISPR-associated protein Csx3 [Pyrobaculum sp.]
MKWKIEKVKVSPEVEVVKIVLSGMLEPAELPTLIEEVVRGVDRGVEETIVISGRLPVWAFTHIAIAIAATGRTVAIADPKLAGAVTAQGAIIPLPPEAF